MSFNPVSIIERQVDAYNRHDLEGFLACYSQEAVLSNLQTGVVIASGRDELRPIYRERFSHPNLHAKISNRMVLGNMVIDFENIDGIVEGEIVEIMMIYETGSEFIERAWTIRKE